MVHTSQIFNSHGYHILNLWLLDAVMCDHSQDKYLQIWISGSDQALVTLQCTVTVSYRVSSVNLNPFVHFAPLCEVLQYAGWFVLYQLCMLYAVDKGPRPKHNIDFPVTSLLESQHEVHCSESLQCCII